MKTTRVLFWAALGFLLFVGATFAQLVPLELDQTITLPATSGIWDVMPHPDGHSVWVQAAQVDSSLARIYWGRSDSSRIDSLELAVGEVRSVTAFWRDQYEPWIVLESRRWYLLWGDWCQEPVWGDSTTIQAYSLRSDSVQSRAWIWEAEAECNPYHSGTGEWDTDYRAIGIWPYPLSPLVAERCGVLMTHTHRGIYEASLERIEWFGNRATLVANILNDSSAVTPIFEATSSTVAQAAVGDSMAVVTSLYDHGGPEPGWPGSYYWFHSSVGGSRIGSDGLMVGDGSAYYDCSSSTPGTSCAIGAVIATEDAATGDRVALVPLTSWTYRAFRSSHPGQEIWSVQYPFGTRLAAEVVTTNTTEEFLCYRTDRHSFDIWDALTGQFYGTTDTLAAAVAATARLTGRFDANSRRLAAQDGETLKLYRFGAYLSADDRTAPLPNALTLAAFPNPFNPTTQLRFTLPREQPVTLVIYDLTGRVMQTLADETLSAGAHRVTVEGAALASGLYFARLSTPSHQATQKLVLLK